MKRLSMMLLFVLSCGGAFGTSVDFSDYIRVTPTNAAQHRIKFFYHAPVPALVTVEMPFTKGEQSFDQAVLEFSSGKQRFKIPIQGTKLEGDKLGVAFWMDRQTLRESSLKIRFSKTVDIKPTVYVFSLKEFVSKKEASFNKASAGNSAVASWFHAEAHRRAVPEMRRCCKQSSGCRRTQ